MEYSVTINTDASFCHDTKASGFAVWITYSKYGKKQKVTYYGNFINKKPLHSGFAEAMAVLNALYMLVNISEPFNVIYVNCDYMNVEQFIQTNKLLNDAFSEIKEKLTEKHQIHFRHVKAHNNKDKSPRTYVNNWLDRKARQAMRKERNLEINKKQKK